MAKYREMFVQEASENIQALNHALLQLEKDPRAKENLDAAFRAAHTIKGMAATMGYDQVRAICKGIEDLFDDLRKGESSLTQPLADHLFKCFDTLLELVNDPSRQIELESFFEKLAAHSNFGGSMDLSREKPLQVEDAQGTPSLLSKLTQENENQELISEISAASKTQTIRVKMADLDSLVDLVGEILIAKMRLEQTVRSTLTMESDTASQTLRSLGRLISDLQYQTMKIRLVPVEQIFDRFPRMVRDLCASLGKEIELDVNGQGIELDRTVLDAITDPLLHILRNAIDHGIEMPNERESSNKPRRGTIKLTASRIGDKVSITVLDDGRGINLDQVKTKAIEHGIITEQAAQSISDDDIISLIGTPGLSTASKVTDVSGRGVGMDVVLQKIETVGGHVKITTKKNQGTSITLTIPMSLAIIGGLLVRVEDERYVIPISSVIAIMSVEPEDIKLINNKQVVTFRDQIVPLVNVAQKLHTPASNEKKIPRSKLTAVLIEKNGHSIALIVDSVQSKQDIVLKHLDKAGYSSAATPSEATILSNGNVALVLDSNQF